MIENNVYGADYVPVIEMIDPVFEKSDIGKIAKFMDPIPGWAAIDDCGEFPCTGP